jgi:hypothetical protein
MITQDTFRQAVLHHERCVEYVKSLFERLGFTVSRTGNYDILPPEYYEKQPPHVRLTKLYPDLKAISKEETVFLEVKAEIQGMTKFSHIGLQSEEGNVKLSAPQLAFFINLYRQTGAPTIYVCFWPMGLSR